MTCTPKDGTLSHSSRNRSGSEQPRNGALGSEQPRITMPEKLSESVSGSTELVFPDDASQRQYSLRELAVYDAGEVRSEMEMETDIPQYGSWLPVVTGDGDEGWLTAPSELRQKLLDRDVKPGETFVIQSLEKSGHGESDPYQVKLSFPERDKDSARQAGLSGV